MFSLELPHRGNSNEYIQYTSFNIKKKKKKKKNLKYTKSAVMGFFSKRLKNEFETAVALVNKPSVLKTLKVYCTCTLNILNIGTDRDD